MDAEAKVIYVPKDQVFAKANKLNAIPYDITGAEYSHYGAECTFNYIVKKQNLTDPAISELAKIVRGANTNRFDLAPQAAGNERYIETIQPITQLLLVSHQFVVYSLY